MKWQYYLSIITFFLLFACNSKQETNKIDAKTLENNSHFNLINHKIFKYKTGSVIGYEKSEGEPYFTTINALILDGNYVYFGDNVQKNIKKIDLKTGEVKSNRLNIIGKIDWIREIGIINKHIFVLTTFCLYEFDGDLNLIHQYKLGPFATDAIFVNQSSDKSLEFRIYCEPGIHTIRIDDKFNVKHDSIADVNNKISDEMEDRFNFYNKGKKFEQIESENKYYVKNSFGTFAIPCKISINDNDVRNFDFNDKRIVYFEINYKEMTLHVLDY